MMRFVLPCDRLPWEAAWNRVYWRNFDQFDARERREADKTDQFLAPVAQTLEEIDDFTIKVVVGFDRCGGPVYQDRC